MKHTKGSEQPQYTRVYVIDLTKLLENPPKWKGINMIPIIQTEDGLKEIELPEYLISPIILNRNKFGEEYPCTILEYQNAPSPIDESQDWAVRLLPTGHITTNRKIKSNLSIEALNDLKRQRDLRTYQISH